MAADELMEYLETGTIRNSVNFPSVTMPKTDAQRLVILHKNIPNMISHVTSILAKNNINIENMANRSKGNYACTLIDTFTDISDDMISTMTNMEGIIRVIKI